MTGTIRPMPRGRRLGKGIIWVAVLFSLYATRGWTLPAWGHAIDVSEPPRPADYAMVLTGGEYTRPFVAAGMYKYGHVGGILIARMRLTPDATDGILPPESELIRSTLILRGVPEEKVTILPGEINSTADEAQALASFLEGHPDATVAIVTNDFHTRRARRVFRKALGTRAGQIYMFAAPTDGFSAEDWWQSERGFMTYLGETVKSGYYALR